MRVASSPSSPAASQSEQLRYQTHTPQAQSQPQLHPPHWASHVNYPLGAVVWCHGTFWRSEEKHASGPEPSDSPTNNLHLWTPVDSSQNYEQQSQPRGYQQRFQYQQQQFSGTFPSHSDAHSLGSYPNQGQSSAQIYYDAPPVETHLHAPVPTYPNAHAFPSSSSSSKSDSSSSGETATASPSHDEKRAFQSSGGYRSMDYFVNKAAESMRHLTLREESHKSHDQDELKDELRGKRIWRVGGVGVLSYSLGLADEETKQKVWREWEEKHGQSDWVAAARARTNFYARGSRGVKPLFTWKLVERGSRPPQDALPIGYEADGASLFAARAWFEGGIHLGKAGHHLHSGASISYGGSEKTLQTYEVFCGPIDEPYLLKWMTFRHGETAHVDGWLPVEGGREKDGSALLLAKGEYESGQHPGKCLVGDDHACVGFGGGELWVRPFQILAYATLDRR